MNHIKKKFIFNIISLVLIQAFLVMDIAWAGDVSNLFCSKKIDTAHLAPKLTLEGIDIQNFYNYFSKTSPELIETIDNPLLALKKTFEEPISRRNFFRVPVNIAEVLTGVALLKGISGAAEREVIDVKLKDLAINFENNISDSEINKYINIIRKQGLGDFYQKKATREGKVLIMEGWYPLNAEQEIINLNNLLNKEKLDKQFQIQSSVTTWKNTVTYKTMELISKQVSTVSQKLGFEKISEGKLIELYEGVTWVESKFKHWQQDVIGRVKPVKSYTNAIGVTQLIESQAVKQIANWVLMHKGGLLKYADTLRELERIINKEYLNDPESVHSELKDFISNKNSLIKRREFANKIRRKILANNKLIGVNLYYALAVWEFLTQKKELGIEINDSLSSEISDSIKELIESGPGGYKPESYSLAKLQFNREYFRANLIYYVVGDELILSIIHRYKNNKDRFNALMAHFRKQIRENKVFNQRLGYIYLTIMWDWARRLDLRKNSNGKFEFIEKDPQNQTSESRKFDEILAAAASYNSGRGTVINALENFGNTTDNQGVSLWIKNMVGANPNNIREPINYLRMYLEDKFQNTGSLSGKNYIIHKNLIQERYKRLYIKKNSLREYSQLTRQNGMRRYKEYTRKDSFDYNLAASLARILGSGYVDSYLLSYGIRTNRWETEIFYLGSPTFDLLAVSRIDDLKSPHYAAGQELRSYLKQKGYEASLAALDNSVQKYKSEQGLILVQEHRAQRLRDRELSQKRIAAIKYWGSRLGIAGVLTLLTGGTILIIGRRIKLGAKPKAVNKKIKNQTVSQKTKMRQQRSSGAKYKQNISFWQKVKNTIFRKGKGNVRFFMFAFFSIMGKDFLEPLISFAADGTAQEIANEVLLLNTGILLVAAFLIYLNKKLQSIISDEETKSLPIASDEANNELALSADAGNAGPIFLAKHVFNVGILKGQAFDNLSYRDKEIIKELLFDDLGDLLGIAEINKISTAFIKLAQIYSDVKFSDLSAEEVISKTRKIIALDSQLDIKNKTKPVESGMPSGLGLVNKHNLLNSFIVEQSI